MIFDETWAVWAAERGLGRHASPSPLCALMRVGLARAPAGPAVEDGTRSLSFADLALRVPALAGALHEAAGGLGGRVAVSMGNRVEWIEAWLAAFQAGVGLVPLHPELPEATVRAIVRRTLPAAVVADVQGASVARVALDAAPGAPQRIAVGEAGGDWERMARSAPKGRPGDPGADAVAAVFPTSGTTGEPKGVVVTHANWAAGLRGLEAAFGAPGGDDVLLHVTALSHTASELILPALAAGARQVVLSDGDCAAAAERVGRGEGTRLFLSSAMLESFVDAGRRSRADGGRLRSLLYGGAPVSANVIERALTFFGPVLEQGYGQTETFPPTLALSRADHVIPGARGRRLRESLGRPVPTCEVRLVDAEGTEEVAPGAVGEIAVRGANVTPGYFGDEAATARAKRGGFHLTGDVAVRDPDGTVRLMGRRAEALGSSGRAVHARQVEREAEEHPDVREAAACEVGGSVVLAVVPRGGDGSVLLASLRQRLADRLGPAARPSRIVVVPALPRNANRKLERGVLAEILGVGCGAAVPREE
ncbi:MAG: acyl--CoA ligase [Deltaproteobacteria bacterium]|nr:acyl--CoA ligase [Deltaproteobacteria bacterium]